MINNIDPISGADLGCVNCAKLRARIAELEDELTNRDDEMAAAASRLERVKAEGRSLKRKLDEAANEADFEEWKRSRTVGDIQRAMDRSDEGEISRGLQQLKRGW